MIESALTTWLPWALKLIVILVMMWLSRPAERKSDEDERRVQIVVLGDLGRSPRMQYHALSIARHGGQVDLIGYRDSDLHPQILAEPGIEVLSLAPYPDALQSRHGLLFVLLAPLKVIFQVWALWSQLYLHSRPPRWTLIQNPPSIPTLAVALLACHLRDSRLVIDWHNFGYSILALKLGPSHPLVTISRLYEQFLAPYAHAHLCVTHAMARILASKFRVFSVIFTLHDRPAPIFRTISEEERMEFLGKLPSLAVPLCDDAGPVEPEGISTPLLGAKQSTNRLQCLDRLKRRDTKLIVSATSWTPDEDFSLLLEALEGYCISAKHSMDGCFPNLMVIITGKGPQKAAFEASIAASKASGKLSHASIQTTYFDDIQDYAKLLGAADLGISLHTSSSGVDLPMKVVDMFGAGLPVLGWGGFESWAELVHEGRNGLGFTSSQRLEENLKTLFSKDDKTLRRLKNGAIEEGKRRWDDEWDPVGRKLFEFVHSGKHERSKAKVGI